MNLKRIIATAMAVLTFGTVAVATATPAQASGGCLNIATIPISWGVNNQGDPTTDQMHVASTCKVYTWDVTIEFHACAGTVEVYLSEYYLGTWNYEGYHVVYVCGMTHILMTTLAVSTYFQISIHQMPGGPAVNGCVTGWHCYVTQQH